jgi:flagellar protein FlgJ
MIQATPTLASTTPAAKADAGADANRAKLKSAAQAFEAVFLRQMIGSMRQASLGDGMFDNEGTEQFQDMADSKTADSMSQKGVLHLADMLVKQLGPIAAKTDGASATAKADDSAADVTSLVKPKTDVTALATAKADITALPAKADVTLLATAKAAGAAR